MMQVKNLRQQVTIDFVPIEHIGREVTTVAANAQCAEEISQCQSFKIVLPLLRSWDSENKAPFLRLMKMLRVFQKLE
jgi:hypothetical protein